MILSAGTEDSIARVARRQAAVNWSFAAAGLTLFFGYVLLMVFARPLLTERIYATSSISRAVLLGYVMLLLILILTGFYVFMTARYVHPMLERLRREQNVQAN